MMEQMHTDEATKTATKQRNRPNTPLRDPVQLVDGIMLVYKHNHKAKGIDYKEVQIK